METLSGVKFSLNFNVREPKKTNGKTNLYCVIKVGNRQIKMPIGVNVWAYQWNKKMQMCNVSPMMVINDRENNINANKKIFEIKAKGMEIINYLCGGYEDLNAQEIENLFKNEINNIAVMANEQNLRHDIYQLFS